MAEEIEEYEETVEEASELPADDEGKTEEAVEGASAAVEERQPEDFTDEEVDAVADTAIAALQDILKYFDVGEVTIDEYDGDEGELILDITGDDLAVLIGIAQQQLTMRHLRKLDEQKAAETIDIEPVKVEVTRKAKKKRPTKKH